MTFAILALSANKVIYLLTFLLCE